MILALDAGNTRIKWALWADGFLAQGSIASARADQLFEALQAHPRPVRAIGSNVAGDQVRTGIETSLKGWRMPVEWIASSTEQCGVRSRYAVPGQLGSDRWAALIGARARDLGAAVVVDCGTAATVDALTAEGEFLGGLILPGVDLMRAALAGGTAGLPPERGSFQPFPRNTADAIHSGAVQAICGAVDRTRCALLGQATQVCVLLTGGAASAVAPRLCPAPVLTPNLVLEGLVEIARA